MAAHIGAPAAAARAHEELFAYWAGLRKAGALPGREDIHPKDMKRLLPTVSLIDVVAGDPPDFRLRLADTGLYSVYGREITGRRLEDIATEYFSVTSPRLRRAMTRTSCGSP